jgi:uncharacterized protein YkwD
MAREDPYPHTWRWPAVIVGLLLGVTVVAGTSTARWWSARIGLTVGTRQPERPVGQVMPCLGGSTCLTPEGMPAEQQQLIGLVAGERARAGCRPVMLDSRLQRAAQDYAQTIGTGGRPSHIDTGQRTPLDRAEAAGYHGRVLEDLAVGIPFPDDVIDLWLNGKIDPSLRTRLDNCDAITIGLGYTPARADSAYGPGVWVLMLGQAETG